jgi:hypothetical protein
MAQDRTHTHTHTHRRDKRRRSNAGETVAWRKHQRVRAAADHWRGHHGLPPAWPFHVYFPTTTPPAVTPLVGCPHASTQPTPTHGPPRVVSVPQQSWAWFQKITWSKKPVEFTREARLLLCTPPVQPTVVHPPPAWVPLARVCRTGGWPWPSVARGCFDGLYMCPLWIRCACRLAVGDRPGRVMCECHELETNMLTVCGGNAETSACQTGIQHQRKVW